MTGQKLIDLIKEEGLEEFTITTYRTDYQDEIVHCDIIGIGGKWEADKIVTLRTEETD